MAQSMPCNMMIASGSLKLEGGLAAQGAAANARLLNGKSSNPAAPVMRSNVSVIAASVSRGEGGEETTTTTSSRRSMLSVLAATVAAAGVFAKDASALTEIVLKPAPPPSGGLPGTENADEARDTDLDLAKRFFLQSLPPDGAVTRIKDAVGQIVSVKDYIDKKAWPYVQNDLRSKAQYLGFDLKTIIDSKAKADKKPLSSLKAKIFASIYNLDAAAREKSPSKAAKAYDETVSLLNQLVDKLSA